MKSKRVALWSLALIGMLFSGCGGGGGSAATGTGYYVDEPIENVSFTCGGQSGVTGSDGSFTFEIGKSCSFRVGDILLREVDADSLIDGGTIIEDNVDAARFLLSIDEDGDSSNGIQLPKDLAQILREQNRTAIPNGDELIDFVDELGSKIDGFQGRVIPTEDVIAHIDETREYVQELNIKVILGGKTFYGVNNNDDGIVEVSFNKDLTSLTYKDPNGESGSDTISVQGYKLTFGDGSYSVIKSFTNKLVVLSDYGPDGTFEGTTRLYVDRADAQKYYDEHHQNDSSSGENLASTKDVRDMAGYTLLIEDEDQIASFKQMAFIFEDNCNVEVNDLEHKCHVRIVETKDTNDQFVYDATYVIKDNGPSLRFLETKSLDGIKGWAVQIDDNWHFIFPGFVLKVVENKNNGIVINDREPQADNALTVEKVEDLFGYTITTNTSSVYVEEGGYTLHQKITATFNCDGTFRSVIDGYGVMDNGYRYDMDPDVNEGDRDDMTLSPWGDKVFFGQDNLELDSNHQIKVGDCWSTNSDGSCLNNLIIESITYNGCSQ